MGTRVFEMAAVTQQLAVERRQRFTSFQIPEWVCIRFMNEQGTYMQSQKDSERERNKREMLREENIQLRNQTGIGNHSSLPSSRLRKTGCCQEDDLLAEPKAATMSVVIHFEFLTKHGGTQINSEHIRRYSRGDS